MEEQRVRKLVWDRLAEMLGVTISAVLPAPSAAQVLRGWGWYTPVTALFSHQADAGNSGTAETDLYSDTIAAGQLAADGAKLKAEYGGTCLLHATATRQIKLWFGGTAIFDTGAILLTVSAGWTLYATLTRVSATAVRYMVDLTTRGAPVAAYTAVGELTGLTLASTNILKITGQAAGVGAASSDIVAKLSNVIYEPQP